MFKAHPLKLSSAAASFSLPQTGMRGASALCIALVFFAMPAIAAEADDRYRALAQAKAQVLLNDLSVRRRVAKLFPNHQSVFHGVQEQFVNTSAGNLTLFHHAASGVTEAVESPTGMFSQLTFDAAGGRWRCCATAPTWPR